MPGVYGITCAMLKYGGESIMEWLTEVCNVCFMESFTGNSNCTVV